MANPGDDGGTPEPDIDRLGELLLSRAGESGLLRRGQTRGSAATSVALSETPGAVREIRAFPGPGAMV